MINYTEHIIDLRWLQTIVATPGLKILLKFDATYHSQQTCATLVLPRVLQPLPWLSLAIQQ